MPGFEILARFLPTTAADLANQVDANVKSHAPPAWFEASDKDDSPLAAMA
jgi:hypothetical protein